LKRGLKIEFCVVDEAYELVVINTVLNVILCVASGLQANILNLVVFVIKAFVINSEFGLYVRLLSVKVYVTVFVRELIKVVYLGLVLCVYSLCI
jgi:hypothetical protein